MHSIPPKSAEPIAAPQGCTCARLRRLTRRVTAVYDRELAAVGLRVTQYSLLGALQRDAGPDGLPMADLALQMDMDRTTLTRNLQPLTAQGWTELVADPQDRRVRRVRITAAGATTFVAARPHWRRAQQTVNRTLGAQSVVALHQWLDQMTPAFRPDGDTA